MRNILILMFLIICLAVPVGAAEFSAPEAPSSAITYMPDQTDNFGEGIWYIFKTALRSVKPDIFEAAGICVSLIAICMVTGLLSEVVNSGKFAVSMISAASVAVILLQPVNALIRLGTDTIQQINQYGKLLLPIMTAAFAAQGSITKSGALYTATALFDGVLTTLISEVLIPLMYAFLCVAVVCAIADQQLLRDLRKFLKWLPTWSLKIILYVFTGYISITGVVAGTTDAAMLKATKLTVSGMVPVVGNILSDASEAMLVSAGLMKNSVGTYGLLVVIALWIGPFVQIGIQYLMLKLSAGICGIFAPKRTADLIADFVAAMGFVLAMTGAVCLLFLISTVCFMKGVS